MRVLVAEDDLGIGDLVSEDLRDQGYAVDWAQDGDEAWSLLESFSYDLLVLDLMLPGRDGFDLAVTLRAQHNTLPILMLTARGNVTDRVRGLQAGADDYLVKPFHLDELRARILALLRRAGGGASNRLIVGRCTLELAHRRVWFSDLELHLSATEYALLTFLALHPEGYFSREELLEHVWDGDTSIDSRTVDTYILYLRRKLSDDVIETRRGLGYRFRG